MTLKFFLGIRIDLNRIESNVNSDQIKSNPVFLSSNQITLKFDSIQFVRNLKCGEQILLST